MSSIKPQLAAHQQQTVSLRLQQAVRLLQLSSLDYAQTLRSELVSNPFLEQEDDLDPVTEPPAEQDHQDLDGKSLAEEAAPIDGAPAGQVFDDERDSWIGSGTGQGPTGDLDVSPGIHRAAEASLAQHLQAQLQLLPLPLRDLVLARSVVESLDDDGYLRLELDELIDITKLDPPASPDELRIALRRVQSLEPAGVGARTVVECLLLQTEAICCPRERELARAVIAAGLERLARKDTASLARLVNCGRDEIERVLICIRRLDPRPGWRFGQADIRYVVPDVTVKKVRNNWTAMLNEAVVPKLRLHCVYAEMFERQRRGQHPELALQLREARWTLRNIELRFATILGVAQAIVRHQSAFFEHGPLAMKPLALREIAAEVGVHESTVSRVTNNKYMSTPAGVFEFKHFFSRAMTASSGTEVTGTAIRAVIERLLDAEVPGKPLSDAAITTALARQGLVVTRRTVTKYRHLMKIDSAHERRRRDVPQLMSGFGA